MYQKPHLIHDGMNCHMPYGANGDVSHCLLTVGDSWEGSLSGIGRPEWSVWHARQSGALPTSVSPPTFVYIRKVHVRQGSLPHV